MKDRNELLDAIVTAYDNPAYQPVDGKTFCNIACNEIAQKMGCNDLYDATLKRPRTADEIYHHLASNSQDWQEIECAGLQPDFWDVALNAVQFWANSGSLVFAVQSSEQIGDSHGHICIIRPGKLKESGKWGKCPSVMNIGRENFIALGKSGPMKGQPVGLNEAFRGLPRFFVWKGN